MIVGLSLNRVATHWLGVGAPEGKHWNMKIKELDAYVGIVVEIVEW